MDGAKVARNQSKQVGGLGERVLPLCKMPPTLQIAARHHVAVAEEHGARVLGGLHSDHVARHNIWPVLEGRDPPEALSLTLRAVHAALVQTRQLRVVLGLDRAVSLDSELVLEKALLDNNHVGTFPLVVGPLRQGLAVYRDGVQLQILRVKLQGAFLASCVADKIHLGQHLGALVRNLEGQIDVLGNMSQRGIVLPELLNRSGGGSGGHLGGFCATP
mmetsp:Transcript_46269/g.111377  ORF Transcript_46269/g.111377 Transcript_46269/m.111377 type:complete len:217 (+) Transcript_46269:893-1543(+)